MVHWLRLRDSSASGTSLIPGRGTKIQHAEQRGQKTNKQKTTQNQPNNKKQQHNVISAGEGTVPPAQEHQALMNPIRIQSGWRTRGTGKGPTQKARQAPEGLTVLLGEQPKCRDGNDLG